MIAADRDALHLTGVTSPGAGALRALVHSRHAVPSASRDGGRQKEQTMFYTRGSTLQSTVEYLRHALEPTEFETVLARLAADERAQIEHASVTDDVPFQVALALWRSADRALGVVDPQWAERAGAEAIRVRGMQLYSGLIQKPTPVEFLAQHISLFQRYYRPGDMKVTDRSPGRATARLVGFEPGDRLFCRRLTGGWLAAIEIAGAREPQVTHARCVLEGDPFCEWEVRWR